eukprot:Pgem_evm1s1927
MWIKYGLALLKRNKIEETRAALKNALSRLPKRKHIATISKFAQMEFKYGEPERGRTIFEELLSSYPKRVDLWSVYIDQELRVDDVNVIRRLFDRFERKNGDAETMDYVKGKAREYVEGKMV